MSQPFHSPQTAGPRRVWHPRPFQDQRSRSFRVSFYVGEEATWGHRLHDLNGRDLDPSEVVLSLADQRLIQLSCDAAVGSSSVAVTLAAANANGTEPPIPLDVAATPAGH